MATRDKAKKHSIKRLIYETYGRLWMSLGRRPTRAELIAGHPQLQVQNRNQSVYKYFPFCEKAQLSELVGLKVAAEHEGDFDTALRKAKRELKKPGLEGKTPLKAFVPGKFKLTNPKNMGFREILEHRLDQVSEMLDLYSHGDIKVFFNDIKNVAPLIRLEIDMGKHLHELQKGKLSEEKEQQFHLTVSDMLKRAELRKQARIA